MNSWLSIQPKEVCKKYVVEFLTKRITKKQMAYAPSYLDLETSKSPKLDYIIHLFGNYKALCDQVPIRQRFYKKLPDEFWDELPEDLEIIIDTREQKPIGFSFESRIQKLDFGDYTLADKYYNYCFVDRKSESDFKGTFGKDIDRFKRELDRAREFNSYIFVICENNIKQIEQNNYGGPNFKRVNIENVFFNLRSVLNEYGDVCQVLFIDGRKEMEDMIPRILFHGPKLKSVDVQYFLENKYDMD